MSNTNTILKLLSEYKVEIPIIQRDYAQGRKDAHASIVRKNLLSDMKHAVCEGQQLDLNFVYGKAENDKFIPIDGQQRLTTLFLLYLYAFFHDPSKTEILQKFTYETRTTSRDFLKKLIMHRDIIFSSEVSPTDEIMDSEWFVQSWENDPTIQSVLVMLDEIVNIFGEVDDIAKCLIDNEPIVFQFLEMSKLGMEDSLYIKLNARGKPLTSFENFKARFIGRLKEVFTNDIEYINNFELLIDTQWTDIFWKKEKEQFDRLYVNFFGEILINNTRIFKTNTDWYNSLDYSLINKDLYEMAFYTLNFLRNNPHEKEIDDIIFNALDEKTNYKKRILFHAITKYMQLSHGKSGENLFQWVRVIKNLTLNTDIDHEARYFTAIDSVNELAGNWDKLLNCLVENSQVISFSSEQVKEERVKAKIILEDTEFANEIYQAEKHLYFTGQIRSGLYLSKNDEGKYEIEKFKSYWGKISNLFNEKGSKYEHLLRQALLTFGDYTIFVNGYYTLCVDDPDEAGSTPSLKRLFSNRNEFVKALLDKINLGEDFKNQLENMRDTAIIPELDWRYSFINYTELFGLMNNRHLRIRKCGANKFLIIPNKASTGYNHNLYLAALYYSLPTDIRNKSRLHPQLGTWETLGNVHFLSVGDNYTVRCKDSKFIVTSNFTPVFETSTDNFLSEVKEYLIQNVN